MVDGAQEVNYDEAKNYKSVKPKTKPKPVARPAAVKPTERLSISLPDLSDQETLLKIRDMLKAEKGESEAYLVVGDAGVSKRIRLPFMIEVSDALVERLNELVGEGAVSTIAG